MTDTSANKSKLGKWLPALIAALVIVALGAWWFNRSQDASERSDAMASDPNSRVSTGQAAPPTSVPAAALVEPGEGGASAIENADAASGQPVPGADPLSDGVAGRGPNAAPAPTGAPTAQPSAPQ